MSFIYPRNCFVKIGFISFWIIPFRFVSVNFVSIYFVSFRFRFVSVNFVSFRFVSFRFRFAFFRYPWMFCLLQFHFIFKVKKKFISIKKKYHISIYNIISVLNIEIRPSTVILYKIMKKLNIMDLLFTYDKSNPDLEGVGQIYN